MAAQSNGTRITLAVLSQQVADLQAEIRAMRAELRDTLHEHDQRMRCLEREQARLNERAGILAVVATAASSGLAALISFLRR